MKTKKRMTPAEKKLKQAIESAAQDGLHGRKIDMMKMSQYSNAIEAAVAGGTPLAEAVRMAVEFYTEPA